MKLNITWGLLTMAVAVCLSFITPSDSSAGGGDSWVRHIYNNSSQAIVVKTHTTSGNVWFENGCPNSENGPCTIAPNSSAQIKYTTTAASFWGTFYFGNNECSAEYRAGGQPGSHSAPHVTSSSPCKIGAVSIDFDKPGGGDITMH